ncbi:MAG: TonB-dependent receptor [Gammaproteobacteria bacterium]|nr:TonB-dependent receptor [Gammaproteobacteria bacterium]
MKPALTGLLGSALFLSNLPSLHAEDQNAVVVTATRTAQTVDDSLASVTVLTSADIQRSQASSVQELLQGHAGMLFRNSGGLGKSTSLFMRGTNSNHVLVMIDGLKIGSATLGTVSLQDIPVSQIERIEVVRGPRSSLYGSEAIGGVIQIFTKKGSKKSVGNGHIGYGRYNTTEIGGGFSGINDKTQLNLQVSQTKSDGFSALKGNNADEDGYENLSASFAYKQKLSTTANFSINATSTTGTNEYDNRFDPVSDYSGDFEQSTFKISSDFSASDNWQMSIQAGLSKDVFDEYADGISTNSLFETDRTLLSWQNNISLNDKNTITAGLDYSLDEIDGSTNYDVKERTNTALFSQYDWSGDKSNFIVGLRVDDNEAFGTHTTGNVGWGMKLNSKVRLIANYGTGFSAPTFNDLYWPDGLFSYGNPNLKPEESKTAEIALRGSHWQVSLFETKVKNLIVWGSDADFRYTPTNVDKAKIRGLEVTSKRRMGNWQHQIDLSYTDPRDEATGNILRRRAKEMARLSIDNIGGKFNYGVTLNGQGEHFDDAANEERVSGYMLVDLRASYTFAKEWSLRAKIENALDKDYESVKGYNTAGSSAFVSVHYQGL